MYPHWLSQFFCSRFISSSWLYILDVCHLLFFCLLPPTWKICFSLYYFMFFSPGENFSNAMCFAGALIEQRECFSWCEETFFCLSVHRWWTWNQHKIVPCCGRSTIVEKKRDRKKDVANFFRTSNDAWWMIAWLHWNQLVSKWRLLCWLISLGLFLSELLGW